MSLFSHSFFNNNIFFYRYGFNSEGHEVVYSRVKLESAKQERTIIGVNLGKNKLTTIASEDYVAGVKKFGEIADYLVINVIYFLSILCLYKEAFQ